MAYCSEVCGSEHIKSVSGSGCHGFGVRSYLHHFYEECTASVWEQEESPGRSSSQRWSAHLCRVPLALGALVLAAGLVVLVVGLVVPSRIEAFGEGELLFVDRRAVQYNQGLHACVQAGASMLGLGGLLTAAGLLASAFSRPVAGPDGRGAGEHRGGAAKPVPTTPSPAVADGAGPDAFSKVETVQPT
ncbi:neurensin 1-like [Brachyhypopomus gauderio]|uniref:neurensin 1-like n=1 Tax=Brachyhypopomus gauderio TaxID=698409 RepID=UPI0040411810